MNALEMMEKDEYFISFPKEKPIFVRWCSMHKHPLKHEEDWMFHSLKWTFLVSSLYSADPNSMLEREIRHAQEKRNNEKVHLDLEAE